MRSYQPSRGRKIRSKTQTDKFYDIIGYNWFNITKGEWNSCCTFETVQEAIEVYSNVTNCDIELKPL